MSNLSWGVTLTPLIVFLIGLASQQAGLELTPEVESSLNNVIYFFITSAFAGVASKAISNLKNNGS